MHWDLFTIIQQILIILTIAGQLWISILVVRNAKGTEQYVRLMSFCTGLLLFLLCRPLGLTFADLMLRAHGEGNLIEKILMGGVMPFLVGIFVSEGTVFALGMRKPIPIRFMLIVAAFTLSQAAYTNYVTLTTKVTTLDKAFIPNICYAIAVGIWLTWRYREIPVASHRD
ncbi:hypothetical protein EBB59_05100 [Lysobacter pythonis]|uniref:Uncharacterized protein n=1 Tax=Solilutibacter pythonis TaxID=2483112 RepID=A0A3M2HU58_9GAMM|nr:hypothetical protein [Lysobacter pythonis]RMH93276.1 hypothetical protein EBB59_05100 [Lysobacter pythonis]